MKILIAIMMLFITTKADALTLFQETVLRKVVKIHQAQKPGSDYFDSVTGGIYSNKLAVYIGLTMVEVEITGDELEVLGFVKMLVRDSKIASKGIQATSAGIAEIAGIDSAKATIRAQAAATAQVEYDLKIEALKTKLGLTDDEWSLLTGR